MKARYQHQVSRLKVIIWGLLLSLISGSPVLADDTEIFFGSTADSSIKPNVLFILDTSGSMDWTDGESQTRLDRMKDALNAILGNASNLNVGLMRFSGSNGGGPVLFPVSNIDQDVCEIEDCTAQDISLSVNVSQSSDDAEEDSSGAVVLDNTDLNIVDYVIGSGGSGSGTGGTTIEISSNVNDAEEHNGNLQLDSNDLDLMYRRNNPDNDGVGVRFQNVSLPQGAIITNAEIVFTVEDRGRGDVDFDIYGEASDDSQAWADSSGLRITDRNATSAKVDWNNPDNKRSGRNVTTPDLSTIVQEIVSRSGWASGNDMAFMIFLDPGSSSDWRHYRNYKSYNGGGSTAGPKLRVTYEVPVVSGGSGVTTVNQTVGLRFGDVTIPQGATITSANLAFEASQVDTDTSDLLIQGELAVDPATFTTSTSNVSSRTKTAASVTWSGVESWDTIGDKYTSPDISSIIQEIVDQGGFCGGNALSLFLTGGGERVAKSFDGTGDPPKLRVTYNTDNITAGNGCTTKTIVKSIANNRDDAEEDTSNNSVSTGSSDLELATDNNDQLVGLRFQDLDIAQGASVTSAYIDFEIDEYENGGITLTISGEASDDASPFSASTGNISGRTKTGTNVSWGSIPTAAVNEKIRTPELNTVVQAIVNRAGWASGNDMAFIIEKASGGGKRTVESRDGEASGAATLTVKVQWNVGDAPNSVRTVRQRLVDEVTALDAEGGTPIVDSLYEGALYYRGEAVDYGKQRGDNPTGSRSHAEVFRVSHPASYTGGTVYRESGCTDANLNADACKTEEIQGSPVYVSPITDSCQTNHIVLLSDGDPTSNSSAAKVRTMTGDSSCAKSGDEACGEELSNFLSTEDQSDLSGTEVVKTFTVGFALDSGSNASAVAFLKSLATDGDSGYYEASSSADLVNAFDSIIASIIQTTSSFVAPGAAVNQFNRLVHDDEVYFSLFKPESRPFWDGNLKKYKIDTNDGVVDVNSNKAIDPQSGQFKDTARSYWSDSVDGNEVRAGGAAAERSLTRNTFTYITGSSSTTLSNSDNELHEGNTLITSALLGAADATERTNILQWARGVDLKDVDEDGDTSEVRLQYGDPLHSRPIIITYGGTASSPDNTIFFGTNEGYIHAIDAADGSEVFSFIPEQLLPNLKTLYTNSSADDHPYGMDGTIVIWAKDANADNDYYDTGDHVYLYVGMRRGGRSYYALDVTDRTNPEFMWKITGGTGDYSEMGESWSTPVRTKVSIGGTTYDVLVVAGGYDEGQDSYTSRTNDSVGRAIYMINAEDGSLVWEGGISGANETFPDMKYSIPGDVRVIDIDLDGKADMMFAADMGGQVWRFDIDNGAANAGALVQGGVIADLGANGVAANNRRFYTTPDVALVHDGTSKLLTISLGSGWRAHPLDAVTEDRFYMLRDPNWNSVPASYTKLTENDLVDVTTNLDSAGIQADIAGGKDGWYIRLTHTGEKVLSNSVTVANQIIFSTYEPGASSVGSCDAAQGIGRTYVVNVLDGTPRINLDDPLVEEPLDINDRNVLLKRGGIPPEPTVLFTPDPVVLVGPETPVSDIEFGDLAQRTYWRQE